MPAAAVAEMGGADAATRALAERVVSRLAPELGVLRTLTEEDAALLTAMDVFGARLGIALARIDVAAAERAPEMPARETWRVQFITAPVYADLARHAQARLAQIHERVRDALRAAPGIEEVQLISAARGPP